MAKKIIPPGEHKTLIEELEAQEFGRGLVTLMRHTLTGNPQGTEADEQINAMEPHLMIQIYLTAHGIRGNAQDIVHLVTQVLYARKQTFSRLQEICVVAGDEMLVIDGILQWSLSGNGRLTLTSTETTEVDYPQILQSVKEKLTVTEEGSMFQKYLGKPKSDIERFFDTPANAGDNLGLPTTREEVIERAVSATVNADDPIRKDLIRIVDDLLPKDAGDSPGKPKSGIAEYNDFWEGNPPFQNTKDAGDSIPGDITG